MKEQETQKDEKQTEAVADLEVTPEQTEQVQGGGVVGRPDGQGASLVVVYKVP
jgi:hypothetical protein